MISKAKPMKKVCNQCNTLSRDEALRVCVQEACPHKEPTADVTNEPLTEQEVADSPELIAAGVKPGWSFTEAIRALLWPFFGKD